MSDRMSDLVFRRDGARRFARRDDDAWETVVRNELVKLRRRTPSGPRVVPVGRRDLPGGAAVEESPPPAA
jgi:hypothetical protein